MKFLGHVLCIIILFIIEVSGQNQIDSASSYNYADKSLIYHRLHALRSIESSEEKAQLYSQLASMMSLEVRMDSAAHYYLESSRIYKSIGKEYEYYVIQEKLGSLYLQLFNFKFAINALKEASKYYLDNEHYRSAIKTLNLLGQAYSSNNQEIEARRCFIQALEINNNTLHDTLLEVENKTLIVKNDMNANNYRRAIKFALSNIKQSEENSYNNHLITNLMYAGQIYYQLNNYDEAIKYLERAEAAITDNTEIFRLPDIYRTLALAYLQQGDKEKVTATFEKYEQSINDVKNTAIVKSSQEIAEKFDSKNKDILIKQLENENAIKTLNARQQRITIYGLVAVMLFIGLMGYLIYRNYKNQLRTKQIIIDQRNELQEQRLQQIEKDSQIKAMESMLLGQEAERNRIGKDLHDSLGAMLSTIKLHMSAATKSLSLTQFNNVNIFQKTKDLIDDACEEVRKVSRDMMPITLSKYGLNTALEELVDKYTIEGGTNVIYQSFGISRISNHDVDLFVYRIIQELVNNSIKHAEADEILIQINYLADQMVITVEDDGKGFDPESSHYKGMGLKNIDFRVKYLKGTLSVDSKPGRGTTTVIELPVEETLKRAEPKFQF